MSEDEKKKARLRMNREFLFEQTQKGSPSQRKKAQELLKQLR